MRLTMVNPGGDGYSAVDRCEDGSTRVQLAAHHPGVADIAYRARRDAIAAMAIAWSVERAVPTIEYSESEHQTWRTVCAELVPAWHAHAARSFLDAVEQLSLPSDHLPQLDEVTARLGPLTGFRYLPVAGLAPLRHFYRSFGDGVFWSTQYIRHGSQPLYTPEPDICHEVLGHANQLADAGLAALYRRVAACADRLKTDAALGALSKVFWFTVEFGLVIERGEPRAWGAGILSSFGELGAFGRADIRPFDTAVMATMSYDIDRYQPILFAARCMTEAIEETAAFVDWLDDDTAARLVSGTCAARTRR